MFYSTNIVIMKKVIFIVLVNLLAFNMGFAQWQQVNGPNGGNISAIGYDSITQNIYVGTAIGEIY